MSALDELIGARSLAESELAEIRSKLEELRADLEVEEAAERALETLAQKGSERLSQLVKIGLKAIYGQDYQFKREGKALMVDDGDAESDLVDGHGGGLVDVVSTLLRVLALKQDRGGALKTVILDEPMRMVDQETALRAGLFLKTICQRLNLNVLMVTHRLGLAEEADATFTVLKVRGATVLKRKAQ